MASTWLTVIAWISLVPGFLIAGTILYDIFGSGPRQLSRISDLADTAWDQARHGPAVAAGGFGKPADVPNEWMNSYPIQTWPKDCQRSEGFTRGDEEMSCEKW